MVLDRDRFWLPGARRCPSPNCDARPDGIDVDLVVIHNISLPPGQFGGSHVEELFLNCLSATAHPYFAEIADLRVSAHLLVDRQGVTTQFVPFDQRAWHAGESLYRGRKRCNDFSVGIELEGTDYAPYSEVQYTTLASILNYLFAIFPKLNVGQLTGHSDISPGRKTDPGPAFDWAHLKGVIDSTPVM